MGAHEAEAAFALVASRGLGARDGETDAVVPLADLAVCIFHQEVGVRVSAEQRQAAVGAELMPSRQTGEHSKSWHREVRKPKRPMAHRRQLRFHHVEHKHALGRRALGLFKLCQRLLQYLLDVFLRIHGVQVKQEVLWLDERQGNWGNALLGVRALEIRRLERHWLLHIHEPIIEQEGARRGGSGPTAIRRFAKGLNCGHHRGGHRRD